MIRLVNVRKLRPGPVGRMADLTVVAAALSLTIVSAFAQTPAASPPTASPPAAATPAPDSKTSAPAASPSPPPSTAPATPAAPTAQAPATPAPSAPPAAQPPASGAVGAVIDPFGAELVLEPKTVIVMKASGKWDSAFETITDTLKTLTALIDKQGAKPSGYPMIVYTSTDDTGFTFQAEIPLDQAPKTLPKDVSMGKSPDGKALKFVHRGSYDTMDNTYEAITNHLDDKKLEAKDMFIEEYLTDPLKTAEDKLIINVYVPLKPNP